MLLVSGRGDKGLSETLDSQLPYGRANAQCLHSVGPEELVSEEWLDDGWNAACGGQIMSRAPEYVGYTHLAD